MNFKFGIIVADTSRSRAYINSLLKNELKPSWVLLLDDFSSRQTLPGKAKNIQKVEIDENWPEANFNPNEPIINLLKRYNLKFDIANSKDINDEKVINLIKNSQPKVLIYSGYGGAILRNEILNLGKDFLHIHGGYLPEYKGSTTNYYSLLNENFIGASSIFLTKEIDCGPIFRRFKTNPNIERNKLDHIYDSAIRSRVLIDTIKYFKKNYPNYENLNNKKGETYYIIHPVLKHIAILSDSIESK